MDGKPAISGLSNDLFTQLNSPNYYTIYPPILQTVFAISSFLFPKDIYAAALIMKFFILLAECGTIVFLLKLFKQFEIHAKNIAIYALNPLVIIELCGNLHFEAFMIFFLLLSVWWLVKNRIILSGFAMAFAVCAKLLPLMFLPFLIRRLGLKNSALYFATIGATTACFYSIPFTRALYQLIPKH